VGLCHTRWSVFVSSLKNTHLAAYQNPGQEKPL
jgi:hypothetical protein